MKRNLISKITGLICSVIFCFSASAQTYLAEPANDDPTMEFPLIIFSGFDANDIARMASMLEYADVDAYFIEGSATSDEQIAELLKTDRIDAQRIYGISADKPYAGAVKLAAQIVFRPEIREFYTTIPSLFIVTDNDITEDIQKKLNVDQVIDVDEIENLSDVLPSIKTAVLMASPSALRGIVSPLLEWLLGNTVE